jgi:hypothetical protein
MEKPELLRVVYRTGAHHPAPQTLSPAPDESTIEVRGMDSCPPEGYPERSPAVPPHGLEGSAHRRARPNARLSNTKATGYARKG